MKARDVKDLLSWWRSRELNPVLMFNLFGTDNCNAVSDTVAINPDCSVTCLAHCAGLPLLVGQSFSLAKSPA